MEAGNRRKEDSGLIDLDALMREASASASASVEESGERPIVKVANVAVVAVDANVEKKETLTAPPENEPLESTPALVTPVVPARPLPRPSAPSPLITPLITTPAPARRTSSSRALVAGALVLALIGAATFGYVRTNARHAPPSAAAAGAIVTPGEPSAASPRPIEGANAREEAKPAAQSANDLPSAAPSAMPSASPASARHGAPAKPVDAVVTTTEQIPETPARANDLGRAMHDAVGDGSSRVAKVETTQGSGARTLRPSPGAVIGALNAVLPTARECLGPDDAIRVGTVTFRSDGTVANVELSGTRAGDDCIRGAVSRARVEPFADDRFTTRVTVRP